MAVSTMNSEPTVSKSAVPAWKWSVVILMLFATVINYLDRQAIINLGSFIKHDFNLDREGYGRLEAWFGYPYAVFLIVAGILADRLSLRWLYAVALLVWSVAGLTTGFVTVLIQLQLCRAVLGAGEAFNWPVAVGTVRRIIPRESQAFANGVFNSGMTIGAVVTPILVLVMVGEHGEGWRSVFRFVGLAGSIWVVFWLWSTRGERAEEMTPERRKSAVPFIEVFKLRTFWITMVVGIAVNMTWHLYRVWLPRVFVEDLKFSDTQLQYLNMAYFLTADLGSIAFGYLAKKLVTAERAVERVRKIVVLLAAVLCLVATPILFNPGRWVMVPLYCLVGAGTMGVFAMFYSFVQDIIPEHTSKCLGLIGSTVWFMTSFLHPLIGRFADHQDTPIGKLTPALFIVGFLPLIAAIVAQAWPQKQEVPST
jgi:ACS family hexuronate transporter-like MFS transporter